MFDRSGYFSRLMKGSQGSEEEKQCALLLYNDSDLQMGDKRLNSLAALTYNSTSCQRIFVMLEKGIIPTENPWKVIHKALLIIHTIILYGSELAVDKCVDLCKFIYPLQEYNSALVKKGFFNSGGTDYGAPVRLTAKTVVTILMQDGNIRKARHDAREGQNTLVPMGEEFEQTKPSQGIAMTYGQAVTSSVGAGFSLEAVPGMYEGRPDRYFDNINDRRNTTTVGNSQITRDKLAPSLLDLVFDSPAASTNPNLPQADYLPALEKQKQLEKQLAEQQELLRQLQQQQQYQQQQQFQQQPYQAGSTFTTDGKASYSNDLLNLNAPVNPPPTNNYPQVGGQYNPQQYQTGATQQFPNQQFPPQQFQNQQFPTQQNFPQQRPSFTTTNNDLLGLNAGGVTPNSVNQFQPVYGNSALPSGNNAGSPRIPQGPSGNYGMQQPPIPANQPVPNESSYLEGFHRQYQSHSIRYTESPINPNPSNPAPNSSSSANYDPSTQLWSFDHNRAPIPPPPLGYNNNNFNPNNNLNNNLNTVPNYPPAGGYQGGGLNYGNSYTTPNNYSSPPLSSNRPPDLPSGPPPPVPPPQSNSLNFL